MTRNIALFVSGTGSNARKIIEYFQDKEAVNCPLLISNKASAPALAMAEDYGLETMVLERPDFYESEDLLTVLEKYDIHLIVLAGFLWLIPPYLVAAYPRAIINIHPALLPKFGGKGMYGMHVHRAVKAAHEEESGITIHYVNERYDEGDIIFQARCQLEESDGPELIAQRVQALEHRHFAPVIERLLSGDRSFAG
ncbi:MAG TPA: phosphoribosylglycinamide formyltransferase [Saprospiraceae bacterium]|nr:phosphoribosylglycinamide formyltransferase [Saprospiraceae bacterium]